MVSGEMENQALLDALGEKLREERKLLEERMRELVAQSVRDQRELLHEIMTEALEDFALAGSIREGRKTAPVSRDAVMRTLRGKG